MGGAYYEMNPLLERSDMARDSKGITQFTCHPLTNHTCVPRRLIHRYNVTDHRCENPRKMLRLAPKRPPIVHNNIMNTIMARSLITINGVVAFYSIMTAAVPGEVFLLTLQRQIQRRY